MSSSPAVGNLEALWLGIGTEVPPTAVEPRLGSVQFLAALGGLYLENLKKKPPVFGGYTPENERLCPLKGTFLCHFERKGLSSKRYFSGNICYLPGEYLTIFLYDFWV